MNQVPLRRGSAIIEESEYFIGTPIGGGFIWYGNPTKIPYNCRICSNMTLDIVAFPELYDVLEGAWGTDGINQNLPDMRGRTPRGVDAGAGRDPDASSRTANAIGGNTGDLHGSVQLDALGTHNHNALFTTGSNAVGGLSTEAVARSTNVSNIGGASIPNFNVATGGNENRMKNANVYFVIRVS